MTTINNICNVQCSHSLLFLLYRPLTKEDKLNSRINDLKEKNAALSKVNSELQEELKTVGCQWTELSDYPLGNYRYYDYLENIPLYCGTKHEKNQKELICLFYSESSNQTDGGTKLSTYINCSWL